MLRCVSFAVVGIVAASGVDVSVDVAYLHAVASVHEFCAADFDMLCGSGWGPPPMAGPPPPMMGRRSLSEMVISMTALIADDEDALSDDVDHSRPIVPLMLGPGGDRCLRSSLDQVSEACAHAISMADATEPALEPPADCARFALAAVAALLVGACLLKVFKSRQQLKTVKKILNAIRANPDLRANVEAVAGVALPAPRERSCCACLLSALAAAAAGYLLTLLLGPPLALLLVWLLLLGAVLKRCVKAANTANSEPTKPRLDAAADDTRLGSYEPPTLPNDDDDPENAAKDGPKLLV